MALKRKSTATGSSTGSEERLVQRARLLIANGRHTTASLAEALRVSTATAFRLVQELRRRGEPVGSVRRGRRWFFVLEDEEAVARAWERDPLLRAVGLVRGRRPSRGDPDDELYARE